jgi:glycosyltransferase involved in cell wall biosynthesis
MRDSGQGWAADEKWPGTSKIQGGASSSQLAQRQAIRGDNSLGSFGQAAILVLAAVSIFAAYANFEERMTPSVVFLNRFYAPDVAATAQMLSDLAEALALAGWRVSVIASRGSYDKELLDLRHDEMMRGVRIRRVSGTTFGRGTVIGRSIDYLSYGFASFIALLRGARPDVIVAMSDPPFILLVAVLAARMRGAAVCYWAQDVYPALAAKLGVLDETKTVFRLLTKLSARLLRSCELVIALGPAMVRALVREGAPADRTVAIHNWADEEAIRPIQREENWFLRQHGLEGKFIVLYSGNAGRGHTFWALCEVMERFRTDSEVRFVFIGGGKKSNDLRNFAAARNLPNAKFLDYVARRDLAYSLSAANVSIVTEDPSVAGLLLPSKTYGILASGRPMIFVGDRESDVAEIVRQCQCGAVVSPDDPDSLESWIRRFMRDEELAAAAGAASRFASETVYSKKSATVQWSAALVSAIKARDEARALPQSANRSRHLP